MPPNSLPLPRRSVLTGAALASLGLATGDLLRPMAALADTRAPVGTIRRPPGSRQWNSYQGDGGAGAAD